MSEDNQFRENKPQMKAPRVTPLEGVSTYAPAGAYVSMHCGGHDADERRLAPDFFGSLGKGMLAKENLEILGNSSGLTPLGFGDNLRNKVMDRNPVSDGFSTTEFTEFTEFTENTEILKNSSGLTPLRPFGKNHKKEVPE